MFLDALHRVFSADEGRLERLLVALAPSAAAAIRAWIAPVILLLATFGVAFGALRTRQARRPLIVGDMPFGSYQVSDEDAVRNAIRFVK